MKSSETCKLLQITKPTLYTYKNHSLLKAIRLPKGYWDFDQESIYSFFNKDIPRKTYAYARVPTNKQNQCRCECRNEYFKKSSSHSL